MFPHFLIRIRILLIELAESLGSRTLDSLFCSFVIHITGKQLVHRDSGNRVENLIAKFL